MRMPHQARREVYPEEVERWVENLRVRSQQVRTPKIYHVGQHHVELEYIPGITMGKVKSYFAARGLQGDELKAKVNEVRQKRKEFLERAGPYDKSGMGENEVFDPRTEEWVLLDP